MSTQTATVRGRVRSALPWGFVVALVLVSLNLRAPFVAVAPIADRLRDDLGVSATAVGVLTSLPVLCFGLLAPVALLVIRRTGAELAVVACLVSVILGSLLRSSAAYGASVAGTLVIGLGLTVGNVVVPVLIRRESSARQAGVMTGIYVSAMNIGSMIVSVATVPIADAGGWRLALDAWAAMAAVGLAAWLLFMKHDRRPLSIRFTPLVMARPLCSAGMLRRVGNFGNRIMHWPTRERLRNILIRVPDQWLKRPTIPWGSTLSSSSFCFTRRSGIVIQATWM